MSIHWILENTTVDRIKPENNEPCIMHNSLRCEFLKNCLLVLHSRIPRDYKCGVLGTIGPLGIKFIFSAPMRILLEQEFRTYLQLTVCVSGLANQNN